MHNSRRKIVSLLLMIILGAASTIITRDTYSASVDLPDGSQLSLNIINVVLKSNNRWDISGTASFVKNSNDPQAMATELVYTINDGSENAMEPDTTELPWTVTAQDTWTIIDLQGNTGDQFCATIKGVATNGSGSVSECLNLNAQQGDFTINCLTSSLVIVQGSNGSANCKITSMNGFNDPVNLSCDNPPSGITCSFSSSSITPPQNGEAQFTLTVSINANTNAGTYNFNIIGTSHNLTHHFTLQIVVEPLQTAFADLTVTISDNPDPVTAGNTITYTVVIRNNGPSIAHNVVVRDRLSSDSPNFTPAPSSIPQGCTAQNGGMICQLGDLAPNTTLSITTNIQVGTSTSGTITYTVWVSSDTQDPTTPNEASESTEVKPIPVQPQPQPEPEPQTSAPKIVITPTPNSQTVSVGSSAIVTLNIRASIGFKSDLVILPKPLQQSENIGIKLDPPISIYDHDLNGYREVKLTVTPLTGASPGQITLVLGASYEDPNTGEDVVLEQLASITLAIKEEEIFLQLEPKLKRTFVLGEVVVCLNEGTDPESEEVKNLLEESEAEIIEKILEINCLKLAVLEGKEQTVIAELDKSQLVKSVGQNNYLVPVSVDIRDPDLTKQSKHYEMINLPNAWAITMGSREVVVAVLDSGVDIKHQDLKVNLWINNDDACGDGLDNDGNGFIDDCMGWNFFQKNSDVMDESGSWPRCDGHGTHVAGIIAANDNGVGGVGVAPRIKIMPVKVSGNEDIEGDVVCISDEVTVAKAVLYAVDNGAKVINASLGCPNGEKCDMPILGDAFAYAHGKGTLVVVAAGNERQTSKGIDDWQDYASDVIEVSSVDLSGQLAKYSNVGPGVKLSAPGTTVYSTKIGDHYGIKTGTSQAAPMVSGCAALLLSSNDSLTNKDVERILINNARDIGEKGRDDFFGYGVLDCEKALKSRIITLQEEGSVSVALKHKKKVSLVSVKNADSIPLSYFEISIMDGSIKFVKARNWDRDRIDQSTVIVYGEDKPIKNGSSSIILMVVDNKESSYQWKAYDENKNLIASGEVSPR